MTSRSPSLRLALLAFALSAWVEGSTQLRRSVLYPSHYDEFDVAEVPDVEEGWSTAVCRWATRKGRRLSEVERACFGALDLSTAFVILHGLRSKPLLPFLLTPLLGELPYQLPTLSPTRARWRTVLLSSLTLTLLHSLSRAVLSSLLTRLSHPSRVLLLPPGASVVVKGEPLPSSGDECLICSAPGPGGLEAFCTTAPKLHPVHRACFMRWRAAYAHQRPPELIALPNDSDSPERAVAVLQAASTSPFRLTATPTSSASILSLLPASSTSLSTSETPLATLRTSSPPCPGCRSSVLLHFALSRLRSNSKWTWLDGAREWGRLVTGRTIAAQFVAQQGFVLALMSMVQAQGAQMYVRAAGGVMV